MVLRALQRSDEEPVDFFANVISGAVKLTKTLPDGRVEVPAGLLKAGDHVLCMSNGGFGGVHAKLLLALK